MTVDAQTSRGFRFFAQFVLMCTLWGSAKSCEWRIHVACTAGATRLHSTAPYREQWVQQEMALCEATNPAESRNEPGVLRLVSFILTATGPYRRSVISVTCRMSGL